MIFYNLSRLLRAEIVVRIFSMFARMLFDCFGLLVRLNCCARFVSVVSCCTIWLKII